MIIHKRAIKVLRLVYFCLEKENGKFFSPSSCVKMIIVLAIERKKWTKSTCPSSGKLYHFYQWIYGKKWRMLKDTSAHHFSRRKKNILRWWLLFSFVRVNLQFNFLRENGKNKYHFILLLSKFPTHSLKLVQIDWIHLTSRADSKLLKKI